MAHVYRFFGHKDASGAWQLEDDEARHALKVLRLSDGSTVEVVDGVGAVARGQILIHSKSKVSVVDSIETFTTKDLFCRCVMIGALKPGDVDDIVAPLIELGVDRLIVFRQADTAQFRVADTAIDRWRRLARSAAKQAKRPYLLELECTQDLSAALSLVKDMTHKWMLTPAADSDMLGAMSDARVGSGVAVLIGGEKGLSESEVSEATKRGFKAVKLGPWILRARTAAQAAAVFLGMIPRS